MASEGHHDGLRMVLAKQPGDHDYAWMAFLPGLVPEGWVTVMAMPVSEHEAALAASEERVERLRDAIHEHREAVERRDPPELIEDSDKALWASLDAEKPDETDRSGGDQCNGVKSGERPERVEWSGEGDGEGAKRVLLDADGLIRVTAPEGRFYPCANGRRGIALRLPDSEQEQVAAMWRQGEHRQLLEFDAWLSFRPEFYEVLDAFRKAFGTDTSAASTEGSD